MGWGEEGALVLNILALQFADWHWDSPPREKARKTKNNTNTKTNEKGEGKGRGTNNILFNGCLNENIVSHHHTERKLLAKKRHERERESEKTQRSRAPVGQAGGGARWGRSPSLPPRMTCGGQAGPQAPGASRQWGEARGEQDMQG